MTHPARTLHRGTVEYLEALVTCDMELDTQPVAFSFDRETWHTAEWIGSAGLIRTARLLVGDMVPLPTRSGPLYVRITNTPEIPIIWAGTLRIA